MDIEKAIADSNVPIDAVVETVRRFQVHEINKTRWIHGEYHHLFPIIKKYPEKFKKYTRMDLNTFQYKLSNIEQKLTKKWCNLHQPIYPEEQLVVTLRMLATGNSYSALAFSFRMGESTVCTTVKNVMTVLWKVLQPIHMPVPNEDDFHNISEDFFLRWNFPHCLGAIDCRHMRIIKPAHSKSLFYNWKGFHSIKLQAVVDANYRFIFIEVGDCGSAHDSSTFTNSKLFQCFKSGKIKFLDDDNLPNSKIILPYHLIGDGAYMLQQHLLKPYRGKNLSLPQKMFNERLSRARIVVECAFGHLVQIWRIFLTTMEHTPETASLITKCACLLRNIIIDKMECGDNNTLWSQADITSLANDLIGDIDIDKEYVVGYGKECRDELTKYLMEHPIP